MSDTTADSTADSTEPGYAEALAELERILAELDRDSVDVDVLAARVERASVLIRQCRDRIAAARLQVDHVLLDADA
jgi:exodeoxyribonuclease VII small subunit